jgi:hypothetical protein
MAGYIVLQKFMEEGLDHIDERSTRRGQRLSG